MKSKIINHNKPLRKNRGADGIEIDNIILLSPIASNDKNVSGITAETKHIMEEMQLLLKDNMATMEDIIKLRIYLTNINGYKEVLSVLNKFIEVKEVILEVVGVTALLNNANIEIVCLAETEVF